MKDYKEYSTEISKCSKCGLCKNACPIWKVLKTEESYPRGKMNLLNLFNGRFPSKELVKIIDTCSLCEKCDELCPSLIPCSEIFKSFKQKYSKRKLPIICFFGTVLNLIVSITESFLPDLKHSENNKKTFLFCPKNSENCEFFDNFINNHPILAFKAVKKFFDGTDNGDTVIIKCNKCKGFLKSLFFDKNVLINTKK